MSVSAGVEWGGGLLFVLCFGHLACAESENTVFTPTGAYSGFSVDDIAAARTFYGEALGLNLVDDEMGSLRATLPGGAEVFTYPKDDHEPATFTILNFVVEDVEVAVDQLNAAGVRTTIYDDSNDQAGNVLSVLDG